jgi:hypothetical protein
MVEFRGTHGTCASRAKRIQAHGFQLGTGRQGTGAYFWRENRFSRALAIAWFRNARNLRSYDHEADTRCAVISAIIVVGEEEWLDLCDPEAIDNILCLFVDKGFVDDVDASKLFEEYIELVEHGLGIKFKLIQTQAISPNLAKEWPRQSIGRPFCYVVKDSSCITITNVEILENREIEP